jgi:TP901 family phage tail tape measure protein
MAKQAGGGLKFSTQVDISESKKRLLELKKLIADVGGIKMSGDGKSFDSKPLTDYQKELLKIKQASLDLAKQKADDAKAEKSASIAFQEALKQERLAREAINTQIANNKLTQQQSNQLAKEQVDVQRQLNAEANKRKPTQVSNSQAEIDAYKKAQQGSILYTSAIQNERVERAKNNVEAAKQAIANGTLTNSTNAAISATQQQAIATRATTLSKKQLAQMLSEEKFKQQQATAELKNNSREMLNSKGSIEQRRAALIRLTTAYDRLSAVERNSAAGMRMATVIKGVSDQVKELESATGRAQRNVGNYGSGLSGFFSSIKSNILSVLGPMALLTAAVAAAKEFFSDNVKISDNFVDVQRTAKLTADEVDRLGESLKNINTRTSLEGLLEIGFIGGRLGVAKEDLVGFITQVDELAVVLKKEFPGGAEAVATSLGKIIAVYKIVQKEGITLEDAMRKTGSAILELSHNGGAPVQYLQEFALGTASISQVVKLSLPTLLAYGSVLSKAGVQASTAATNVTRFLSDLTTKREKYFAIAQLEDSTLTLEKFTNLINTDAKQALDLFFKGLRSGNPSTTDLAERLKSLNLTAGKTKNTVIALSEAQDTLAKTVPLINNAYDDGISVSHNFELANNSLAASFDKIKNSIINAFISSDFSRRLAELLNTFTDTRSEAEKLSEAFISNRNESKHLHDELDPLVKRYDELKKTGKLNKDEQTELKDVIIKISELMPGVATSFDAYGNALDINRKKVTDLTKAQKDLIELQNRNALKKANKEFADNMSYLPVAKNRVQSTSDAQPNWIDRISNLAGGDIQKKRLKEAIDVVTEVSGNAYKAAKSVRELGGALNKQQKDIIAYYEGIEKAKKPKATAATVVGDGTNDEIIAGERTTEVIKQEIKNLTAENKRLGIATAEFKANVVKLNALKKELKLANGGVDTGAVRAAKEEETAVKRRNDLQQKVDELSKKGVNKQLDADEEELESVRDKYAKMREEAIKFNKDPKNKGLRVDAGGLLTAQSAEEDAVRDKQASVKLKVTLDEQKQLYADYEAYKDKVGKEAADKRYADLIVTENNYLKDLQRRRDQITDPQKSKGGSEVDVQAAEAQLKVLDDAIAKEKLVVQKKQDDLIASLLSFEQERTNIVSQAEQQRKELGDSATKEQLDKIDKDEKLKTDSLSDAHLKELDEFKNLYAGIDRLSDDNARKLISSAEDKLNSLKADGLVISKELETELKRLFADSKLAIEDRLPSKLIDLANQIDNVASSVKGIDAAFGAVLSTLANVIGQVGNVKKGINDFKEASAKGDTLGKLSAGAGIVGAAASVASAVVGYFKGLKAANEAARKYIDDYNRAAIQGELDYQALLRKREQDDVARGKTSYQGLVARLELLKKQSPELEAAYNKVFASLQGEEYVDGVGRKHGTLLRKTKTWDIMASLAGSDYDALEKLYTQGKLKDAAKADFESLRALRDELKAAGISVEELGEQLKETLTGTSVEGLSDALSELFENGKTAASDFGDTFENIMRKAILNSFKLNTIQKAMQPVFDSLGKLFNDGKIPGEAEIQGFLDYATTVGAGLGSQFKVVDELLKKLNLTGPEKDKVNISGKLQRELTEQTGSQFLGVSIASLEQQKVTAGTMVNLYKLATDHFNSSLAIQANTLRTADNTERLKGIEVGIATIATNTTPKPGVTTTKADLGIGGI